MHHLTYIHIDISASSTLLYVMKTGPLKPRNHSIAIIISTLNVLSRRSRVSLSLVPVDCCVEFQTRTKNDVPKRFENLCRYSDVGDFSTPLAALASVEMTKTALPFRHQSTLRKQSKWPRRTVISSAGRSPFPCHFDRRRAAPKWRDLRPERPRQPKQRRALRTKNACRFERLQA